MYLFDTGQSDVKRKGPEAMDLKMPYDEQKFLTAHIGFVTRGLGFQKVQIYDSEDPKAPNPSNLKANAMPKVPVFCFYHDESSDKKPPPSAPGPVEWCTDSWQRYIRVLTQSTIRRQQFIKSIHTYAHATQLNPMQCFIKNSFIISFNNRVIHRPHPS